MHAQIHLHLHLIFQVLVRKYWIKLIAVCIKFALLLHACACMQIHLHLHHLIFQVLLRKDWIKFIACYITFALLFHAYAHMQIYLHLHLIFHYHSLMWSIHHFPALLNHNSKHYNARSKHKLNKLCISMSPTLDNDALHEEIYKEIDLLYNPNNNTMLSNNPLDNDPISPQSKALTWMTCNDLYPRSSNNKLTLQRFVIVAFYFSHEGNKWMHEDN